MTQWLKKAKITVVAGAMALVVVVTGWDPDTVREELEGAGVDHIRQKPFDMDDMLQLVPSLTA
jgi:hypothetical protein